MRATESNLRSQRPGISEPLPYSVLRAGSREGISIYKERGCSPYLLGVKKVVLEPLMVFRINFQQQELSRYLLWYWTGIRDKQGYLLIENNENFGSFTRVLHRSGVNLKPRPENRIFVSSRDSFLNFPTNTSIFFKWDLPPHPTPLPRGASRPTSCQMWTVQ